MSFFHTFTALHATKALLISVMKQQTNLLTPTKPTDFLKLLILFCLPLNTALAGKIYFTDFESGSFTNQNGFSWADKVKTSISSGKSKSGAYSLKFTYPASAPGKDSFSEQRFKLGGYYPDIWIKYDLYIPTNYKHRKDSGSHNNKAFAMLWAGPYGKGREGPKIGGHLWSKGNGESTYAAYVSAIVNGKYTLQKNWNCSSCQAGKYSKAVTNNDKGRWMTLVIHMKYASISNNDGVYEIWKTDWQGNTVKMVDIHNGPWYGTKADSTAPARGFNTGYLLGWANSGFDQETVFYIDNITFSTTPLSTNTNTRTNTSTNTILLAPPKPPTIFN